MALTARELSLLSNTNVLGYIRAKNAKRNAQAKAEGWQFWTLMAEELAEDHTNVYDLELRFARGTYSDVYKEWCGCRPSINTELTLAEMEVEIGHMSEMAAAAYQEELDWRAEEARQIREDIALGVKEPTPEVKLEQWEIYEAKAEEAGY
jgi:hypothetical protein